jgi:uncharacterized protein YycO
MKKLKKLSKKVIILIVCACIIASILICALGLQIAFLISDQIECWHPDYEQTDISPILEKEQLDDGDYATLYAQTGLTKAGIDRCLKRGEDGIRRILAIQTCYFTEHKVVNDLYAPYICTDFIEDRATACYLENGDILVTSSTHISSWRMGHAGLVTDAMFNGVLQASAYGNTSEIGTLGDFTERVNFILLSPKVDKDVKEQVATYANENLLGKTYDATAGVFTSKNSVEKTQCSHIVWYAYKQFGIDIDCNGGKVVTPRNIANSTELEVVQVFGFNPQTLWKY